MTTYLDKQWKLVILNGSVSNSPYCYLYCNSCKTALYKKEISCPRCSRAPPDKYLFLMHIMELDI